MHFVVYRVLDRVLLIHNPVWMLLLIFLPLSYVLSSIIIRYWTNVLTRFLYTFSSLWLGSIFFFSIVFGVYELVHLYTGTDSAIVVYSLLAVTTLLIIYSAINAQSIQVKHINIPIKNLLQNTTIVHLSDLHIGTINDSLYLGKIIKKVNNANPDAVLITGDVFDGSGPIHPETLLPFESIHAKTFFSIGNHEVYEGLDNVRNTLKDLSLNLLEDTLIVYKNLQIIAINDPEDRWNEPKTFEQKLAGLTIQNDKPALLMYHQPKNWDIAQKFNIDLQLSGHTHNGQIFPFTILAKIFFPKVYGLYEKNGKYLYTSSGAGTWGPPMRLGSRNEIVVIHLTPAK
jgi:predicted MPP superfamily phosphohydrolase